VVFVVNKWDLYAADVKKREWTQYLRDTFRTMPWAPVAFVTATRSRNVKATIDKAQRLYRQSHTRVPTPRLNDVLRGAVDANKPPADTRGRPVRLYFATQVEVGPPTIVISASAPRSISDPYKRYLINVFHRELPYSEVPIKLLFRGKKTGEGES
jgi:GTP-binding protein